MDEIQKDFSEITKIFQEVREINEKSANEFWGSLSYDDKCNAFHAVVQRLVKGELEEQGSYRYVLYQVFGFEPDMYIRGMDCGFMALHNSILVDDEEQ